MQNILNSKERTAINKKENIKTDKITKNKR